MIIKKWLDENWPRLTVGLVLISTMTFGILYFLGVPLWKISKGVIGEYDGQIIYARSMKESISTVSSEMIREIFIMDLKSGRTRQLTDHRSLSLRPSLSPTSPWLTYTSYVFHEKEKTKNADLFVYNLLTRERKVVSFKKGLNLAGSFSADGKSVYYTIRQGSLLDIFKISVEGNADPIKVIKFLTGKNRNSSSAQNFEPVASPEGERLAFVSNRDGRPTLYIKNLLSGEEVRILFAGVYNTFPRWSPDGKRLVFQGYLKGHFDLFLIDVSGKNLKKITGAKNPSGLPANNESPDFSPNGKQIIFTSDRTGYNQLYIINTDGTGVRRLTYDTFHYYHPRWSRTVLPAESETHSIIE